MHKDTEMIVMKKEVYIHRSLEMETQHGPQSHKGQHRGWSGGPGEEGRIWPRVFFGVFLGRKVQGRVDTLSKLHIGEFE